MSYSNEDWAEIGAGAMVLLRAKRRRYGRLYDTLYYGEPPNWRELAQYIFGTLIAVAVMVWFGIAPEVSGVILFGAALFAYRISMFEGSLKEDMLKHWGMVFLAGSAALVVGDWLTIRLGGSLLYIIGLSMLYFYFVASLHNDLMLDHPLLWRDAYVLEKISDMEHIRDEFAKEVSPNDQIDDELSGDASLFEGISLNREDLDAVKKYYGIKIPRYLNRLDLAEARAHRDTEKVSMVLEIVERRICDFWNYNIYQLDGLVQKRHLAHKRAESYIEYARWTLEQTGFDLQSIAVGERPQIHGEKHYSIPKSLQHGAITRHRRAFHSAGGRALASAATGQAGPVLAMAVVLAALVGAQVYDSRALRQLKDAEGQLSVMAESVVGDRKLIDGLLRTRFLPDMQRLVAAVKLIDSLGTEINRQHSRREILDRKKLTTFAMAYLEGKQLLEIEERIEK